MPKKLVSDRKLRLFACACCRQVWHLLTDPRSRKAVEVAERYADGLVTVDDLAGAADGAYRKWMSCRPADSIAADRAFPAWAVCGVDPARDFRPDSDLWHVLARNGCQPAAQAALLREIVGNPYRPASICTSACADPEEGYHAAHCPLASPTVLSLATAGYEERDRQCRECVDGDVGCPHCEGAGVYYDPPYSLKRFKCPHCDDGLLAEKCKRCDGTGIVEGGTLDPVRFMVLADAMEEAGCLSDVVDVYSLGGIGPNPLLAHLRSSGQHVRGCWALDLILGKE